MRFDELRMQGRQPIASGQGKLNPTVQSRLQIRQRFALGLRKDNQASKTGNLGSIALIRSQVFYLGQFQRSFSISIQLVHGERLSCLQKNSTLFTNRKFNSARFLHVRHEVDTPLARRFPATLADDVARRADGTGEFPQLGRQNFHALAAGLPFNFP